MSLTNCMKIMDPPPPPWYFIFFSLILTPLPPLKPHLSNGKLHKSLIDYTVSLCQLLVNCVNSIKIYH